jgi:hypothetical protein
MATITLDREYVAVNEADFPLIDSRYPEYAKNEIDLFVEIAGRVSDIDNFRYDIEKVQFEDTEYEYLKGTFDSDSGLRDFFIRATSVVDVSEHRIDDETSRYVLVANNI